MKCNKSTTHIWGLRSLCAIVAAGACFGAAHEAAQIWHFQFDMWMQVLSAAVPAALTLVTTKSLALFADSCMNCPTPGAANLKGTTAKTAKNDVCARQTGKFAPASAAAGPNPAKAKGFTGSTVAADTYGTLVKNNKLVVDTEAPGEDGFATITITTTGVTNSQLKVLINRLHNIAGVKWSKHKGLGDGRKQIVGKAHADKRQAAFAQLADLAQKYAA